MYSRQNIFCRPKIIKKYKKKELTNQMNQDIIFMSNSIVPKAGIFREQSLNVPALFKDVIGHGRKSNAIRQDFTAETI